MAKRGKELIFQTIRALGFNTARPFGFEKLKPLLLKSLLL